MYNAKILIVFFYLNILDENLPIKLDKTNSINDYIYFLLFFPNSIQVWRWKWRNEDGNLFSIHDTILETERHWWKLNLSQYHLYDKNRKKKKYSKREQRRMCYVYYFSIDKHFPSNIRILYKMNFCFLSFPLQILQYFFFLEVFSCCSRLFSLFCDDLVAMC